MNLVLKQKNRKSVSCRVKYFLHSMKQQYSAKLHLCNTYICSFSFIYKKKNKPLNISFGTDLRPKSSCNISNLSRVLLQAIVFILYCEVSHEFVGRLLSLSFLMHHFSFLAFNFFNLQMSFSFFSTFPSSLVLQ